MNLVIEAKTRKALDCLSDSKPHALLLSGREGVGLATIAKWLAEQWGETVDVVRPEAKTKTSIPTITVERIRSLYDTTKSKASKNLVAIIDDADAMTESAQNALLKLLEEPNISMHFILTAHAPEKLLSTITSRVQKLHISPVDTVTTSRLVKSLGIETETTKKQLLYVADGLPAAIFRYVSDPRKLEYMAQSVRMAREYVNGDMYNRLLIVNSIGNDRQKALGLMDNVLHILRNSVLDTSDEKSIERIDALLETKERLLSNGNVRLQMTTIMI